VTVVHVSYYPDKDFSDPESWLKKAQFYNGVLEALAKNIEVHDVKVINYSGIEIRNGVTHHFLKYTGLFFVHRLNTYVLGLKPDVVLVAGLLFPVQIFLLKMRLGNQIKIIVQHHAERPLGGVKSIFQKMVDRYIDHYLFASKELGMEWADKKLITADKVVEVMEASSSLCPIDREKARDVTKVTGKVYLWVGRLNKNKDPITLVKAFAEFSKLHSAATVYMLFGDNEMLDEVKKAIRQANTVENILLVGKVAHNEMKYWYNSADFIISTSHYEGSGVAVCEAMSCGCIPILTNIPSFTMMSDRGNCGLQFQRGDVLSLLDALQHSLFIDISRERKKVLAFYKKKLSFEAIAGEMETVFRKP
jgi:glycosyltransferase involved in cell wall biosynthesis